ncbi:DNA-binding transcriptional regulator, AcrR family [Nocardioides scoriae]|uniref:DNA-binding transcriptional regulator, AcrR family n=1 Tax=Nocardioides scoriae TaxID=642780 RepID=A0A1H1LDJ9_9ACTN|nr:TetR/AcrR family transcriptional regulator [Nocardioides scoriae]SDR72420.1 DNA-binding transcriptional regulator, AcrR family [Nocardioides scoriae]
MTRRVKDVTDQVKQLVSPDDGRSSRWDEHREARRAELVDAAVRAIDEHGPTASIAQVSASAGVSRPVLYRYFTDKDDLYRAVGAWGAAQVIEGLMPVLLGDAPVRERVERGCAVYLDLIAAHPHVFFLLVEHRSGDDPLADGKEMVAATIARTLGDALRDLGLDAAGAEPWAHGLVGLGLSTGEWWLRRRTMSRAAVSRYLSSFVWHAFEGIAAEHGVRVEGDGTLRLVAE